MPFAAARPRSLKLCLASLSAAWLSIALTPPAQAAKPAAARHAKPAAARADDAPDVVVYGRRDDVVAFARDAAERQGFEADWAIAQLAQARYQPSVARLVMPPPAGTAKNWAAYRARFVEPQRIREGLRFWQDNEAWLNQAEARWGVPPDMVVAIVGVETFYGRVMGHYKVIDALATLSFDFPAGRSDRSSFYRGELEAFLRWCASEGRDPQAVKGSYAGAVGLPQFMPGSVLKYAIDFDEDGRIDLDRSGADVVGSVAHYFAQFGWQRDLPTHYPVSPPDETHERALLLAPDILPSFTANQLAEHGAKLDAAGRAHDGPLALVMLQNGDDAPSYVAGTRNFYTVTRYNWSSYYAMAVIELARAMRGMRPPRPLPGAAPQGGSRSGPAEPDPRTPLEGGGASGAPG